MTQTRGTFTNLVVIFFIDSLIEPYNMRFVMKICHLYLHSELSNFSFATPHWYEVPLRAEHRGLEAEWL